MTDGVVFLPSFYEAIRNLEDPDRVKVYDAVICYGLYGVIPELPSHLQGYFVLMQPVIDSSQRRYKAAKKNGEKGGAPVGNQNARKKQPKNNQTINQNVNHDLDSDIDIDSDIDSDSEKDTDFNIESETDREKRIEANRMRFLEGLNSSRNN